jgi:hypothetical protein
VAWFALYGVAVTVAVIALVLTVLLVLRLTDVSRFGVQPNGGPGALPMRQPPRP